MEGRIAGGNTRLSVFEEDQRRRDVDRIEILLARAGQHRIVIRNLGRRERARLPKGCGTPFAAADARNLH